MVDLERETTLFPVGDDGAHCHLGIGDNHVIADRECPFPRFLARPWSPVRNWLDTEPAPFKGFRQRGGQFANRLSDMRLIGSAHATSHSERYDQ
ncbi:hypothetical protein ACFY05_05130 [Microtetraspora fusca]|uniref:Uncharacterized protein n=1 Tax=Microtetraspora fusca TaxID=1997 RepID=A0ABW6V1F9_MICFU